MPNIFEVLFVSYMALLVVVGLTVGFYLEKTEKESYKEWCEDNRVIEIEPGIEVIVKCKR